MTNWASNKKNTASSTFKRIALIGNPNVGKSTVFNALTGLHQHTGNWPGKTVDNAFGYFSFNGVDYCIYDLPGTYSLVAHSFEEIVARDFICFEEYDAVIIVCDAVCLERNLNLVLQVLEVTDNALVCVNLLDEAFKKKIYVDLEKLSSILGVPVVGTSARDGKGLDDLLLALQNACGKDDSFPQYFDYGDAINHALSIVYNTLKERFPQVKAKRFLSLQLLSDDLLMKDSIYNHYKDLKSDDVLTKAIKKSLSYLFLKGYSSSDFKDHIVDSYYKQASFIISKTVQFKNDKYLAHDRKIDSIVTSKKFGIPIMLFLLSIIFWITMVGANVPSDMLFNLFSKLGDIIFNVFSFLHFPNWLSSMLIFGIYRTLTWVIAVMLPPMVIFFPLFTILEDSGYLPRVAFNLDGYFKKCSACGKQALTMCMGIGCNALGVEGTRIIDSKRERLIAILTNSFIPCNGRFPTIIAVISMFLVCFNSGIFSSIFGVSIFIFVLLLGIGFTFLASFFLAKVLFKGVPSSFIMELPPYRRPKFGSIIVRSFIDRTFYVVIRAVKVAAPMGLFIWLLANIKFGNVSLLLKFSQILDPIGKSIGLDGVILVSFLLGFPANEIVVPIMLMTYMSTGNLTNYTDLNSLKLILLNNGWNYITAICFLIFTLFHFPCSTTIMAIKKETGSIKLTLLGFFLPFVIGIISCFFIFHVLKFISFLI